MANAGAAFFDRLICSTLSLDWLGIRHRLAYAVFVFVGTIVIKTLHQASFG